MVVFPLVKGLGVPDQVQKALCFVWVWINYPYYVASFYLLQADRFMTLYENMGYLFHLIFAATIVI